MANEEGEQFPEGGRGGWRKKVVKLDSKVGVKGETDGQLDK